MVAAVLFFFPILWMAVTAFKPASDFNNWPPVWFPAHPTLGHFGAVGEAGGYRALATSILISAAATLLSLLVGLPAAYASGVLGTGGWNLAFWMFSQRMLPAIVVAFPVFLLFRNLGWLDTPQALIIMYLSFNVPFVVWMMRGYFRDVPRETLEAALMDGCSHWGTFRWVAVPLSRPGIIVTGVFVYIFSFSEFVFALILTRTKISMVTVVIASFHGGQAVYWGEAGVLTIIAMLPLVMLALAVRQDFARGLSMGAVK
jgi:multiple sugar transport system permease protein